MVEFEGGCKNGSLVVVVVLVEGDDAIGCPLAPNVLKAVMFRFLHSEIKLSSRVLVSDDGEFCVRFISRAMVRQ